MYYISSSITTVYASFYTLLFCGKDIISLSLFTTWGISKCHALFASRVERPLLFKHSTGWLVTRRIDWLVAGGCILACIKTLVFHIDIGGIIIVCKPIEDLKVQ